MNLLNFLSPYEKVIHQMPGFIGIHDMQSKIVLVNQSAAKIMGFKSADEVPGTRYADMKCKASEDEESFEAQDKLIFSGKKKKVSFLSYHQYTDGWKLILGEKSPLINEDKILVGLMSYWSDIIKYNLVDISRFLINSTRKFTNLNDKKFTYLIEDSIDEQYCLSNRQLECLFFLIRGKSDKEIAKILHLSPRTVESYINEIKLKMNCLTRSQATEKAINEGMLNVLPDSIIKHHI